MAKAPLSGPSPRVALNAFQRLTEAWSLSVEESEALLGVSNRTAYRIVREGQRENARHETLERISHLVHIYESLAALFGRTEIAKTWIRRPNADFGEQPPLQRMLHGMVEDLIVVRQYLDRAREGW